MGLPADFKLQGGQSKRVLIDAHRDWLPEAIVRRGKMGFEVPIGAFLRRELRGMFCDVVSRDTVERIGWLDHGAILRLYRQHCQRRAEHGDLLYALLALCWWWRRWMGAR
jgi:asparagine synthase (glutamine-hydrolysing)